MKLFGYCEEGSEITRLTFFSNHQGTLHRECAIETFASLITFTSPTKRYVLRYKSNIQPYGLETTVNDPNGHPLCRFSYIIDKSKKQRSGKYGSSSDRMYYDISTRNAQIRLTINDHTQYVFSIGDRVIGKARKFSFQDPYPAREEGFLNYVVELDDSLTPDLSLILLLKLLVWM